MCERATGVCVCVCTERWAALEVVAGRPLENGVYRAGSRMEKKRDQKDADQHNKGGLQEKGKSAELRESDAC